MRTKTRTETKLIDMLSECVVEFNRIRMPDAIDAPSTNQVKEQLSAMSPAALLRWWYKSTRSGAFPIAVENVIKRNDRSWPRHQNEEGPRL